MWTDPATGQVKNGIKDTNYTHDYLIDKIIANPAMDQTTLAKELGYSDSWISQIMASDSFQVAFERRKEEMVDPIMRHSLEEQFKSLILQSAEVLRRKLQATQDPSIAIKVMENASRALGYGARVKVEGTVNHTHSLISVLSSLPPGPAPRAPVTVDQPKALPPGNVEIIAAVG